MRSIVQRRYGPEKELQMAEVPMPVPGKGQVLVRVHAAGVDAGVWHLMRGLPYLVRLVGFGLLRPKARNPGLELAGVVEELGEGVQSCQKGDAVFGAGQSCYADFALAKAEQLVPKPEKLSWEEAACLPSSGLAALVGLNEAGGLSAGERVLVLGAAGGVGHLLVQLATARHARVTGVCSAKKLDFVRSLGAEQVLDYRQQDPLSGDPRYERIVDIAGNRPLSRLCRALTPKGTLVNLGGEEGGRLIGGIQRQLLGLMISPLLSSKIRAPIAMPRADLLEELRALAEEGLLRPRVSRCYPLESVGEAISDLRAGRVLGKLAIRVSPGAA